MRRLMVLALAATVGAACGDTDVENAGEEIAPGEEVEDSGVELDVTAVDLEQTDWFTEGRTVVFGGRHWIVSGEPVFDPAVTHVGEFEGTPLYAEVNVTTPYSKLFIPLEDDYWQMLEPGQAVAPGADTLTDRPQGVEGIESRGDPTADTAGAR